MTSRIASEPHRPTSTGTSPGLRAVPPPGSPGRASPERASRGPVDGFEGAPVRARPVLLAPAAPAARPATSPVAITPLDLSSRQARRAVATSLAFVAQAPAGAAAPGTGFTPNQAFTDRLGMTHVRLDRTQDGLPVFGEQVITHLGKDGAVASMTGEVSPMAIPEASRGAPRLSARQAIDLAEKAFGASTGLSPRSLPTAALVYLRGEDGQYRKAYQVHLRNTTDAATPYAMNHFVDAQSGAILEAYNTIDTAFTRETAGRSPATSGESAGPGGSLALTPAAAPGPTPRPEGTNATTLYSGAVTVGETRNADGTWGLQDTSRGKGIVTRDANDQQDPAGATDFKDDNGIWNEQTDSARQRSATDAQYAAEMTYDLYRRVLGRDSIDGKGFALANNVHLDRNFVNAYWDGTQMSYGDGDGKTSGPLTSLDIGGHEISHGLTEKTAGLVYSGESGGLNEAMSDIFGKGVEWYAAQKNAAVKFSWGVGEAVWTPGDAGDALRYMDDPTRDGSSVDHLGQYTAGLDVHLSSGIANNAFTLMVQGGANRTSGLAVDPAGALGMEKALQVMYRAETVYFTPDETFARAGAAVVQAATDLYGPKSKEVETVRQAWKAVGCLP